MPQHIFVESEPGGDEVCEVCGATDYDAAHGLIGCEAEDIVNPVYYRGVALTPSERSLGVELQEKLELIYAPAPETAGGWEARWSAWRDQIASGLSGD